MNKVVNYVDVVQASGLVTSRQLGEILTAGGQLLSPDDGAKIGDRLIKAGIITPWQNNKLLKGNSRGFFIGKYKLLNLLGTGGNAAVYLAEHTLLRHRRAVKVLPATEETKNSSLDRFLQEAQVIASLDHPNIVRAYDVDKLGKYYYIAMEYVAGVDLEKLLEVDKVMDCRQAADCIRQAALGLAHAHEKSIVHRDIKPGNLLRDRNGVVKVLDLGLARLMDGDQPSITRKHNENFMGTADYLSPEQAMDSHEVDFRTDIYSLGCTFYFLLAGKPPFGDGALAERLIKHLKQPPPSIVKQRPEVPPALEAVCFQMLEKAPKARQASMTQVAEQLQRWLDTGSIAEPLSAGRGVDGPSTGGPSAELATVAELLAMAPDDDVDTAILDGADSLFATLPTAPAARAMGGEESSGGVSVADVEEQTERTTLPGASRPTDRLVDVHEDTLTDPVDVPEALPAPGAVPAALGEPSGVGQAEAEPFVQVQPEAGSDVDSEERSSIDQERSSLDQEAESEENRRPVRRGGTGTPQLVAIGLMAVAAVVAVVGLTMLFMSGSPDTSKKKTAPPLRRGPMPSARLAPAKSVEQGVAGISFVRSDAS